MMNRIVIVSLFLIICGYQLVCACESIERMDFKEAVELADLIVVGQEINEGPLQPEEFPYVGGPAWIDVKVEEVLKGRASNDVIRIITNEACGYGLTSIGKEARGIFLLSNDEEQGYTVVRAKSGQQSRGPNPLLIQADGMLEDWNNQQVLISVSDKKTNKETVNSFIQAFNLTIQEP